MFLLNYAALNFVCFQEPFYEKLRSCDRDGLWRIYMVGDARISVIP